MSRASSFLSSLVLLAAAGCAAPKPAPAPAPAPVPATRLVSLTSLMARPKLPLTGETLRARHNLARYYSEHPGQLAWFGPSGALPRVYALLQAARNSFEDGLKPSDFHLAAIQTSLEDLERRRKLQMDRDPALESELELLLSDAFFTLGAQLQSGKVKPKMPGYEWYIPQNDRKDLGAELSHAIETDTVVETLKDLLPKQAAYWRLREALAQYRRIAAHGGWKIVTPGPRLKEGMKDKRVPLLRARLLATHDLPEPPKGAPKTSEADPRVFDHALADGLKVFQARHGVKPDGALGPQTLALLNISALKRVRTLELNLERWRWLPRDLGNRYIAVNIAAFELQAVEKDHPVLSMPVVVGNQYRHTPVFTGLMTYVILNPTWYVPHKIAVEDMLPKIRKDPSFIQKHDITVLEKDDSGKWVEADLNDIVWKEIDDENFDFRFRQAPGPNNSLGRMKFIFPNRFDVYLHDTPAKELFSKTVRSFSSGCIRLSKPDELLKYVFNGTEPPWPEDDDEKKINLPEPIPVHILYETAWADESGTIHFRPDLYEQDALLDQYL